MSYDDSIDEDKAAKKKPAKKKSVKVDYLFEEGDFHIFRQVENVQGKIVEVLDFKEEYRTHLGKCLFRTCKKYGVSEEHMKKALLSLNGRKIDGIPFNALVGRMGIYDGEQKNRAQLATEFGTSALAVEISENRLTEILQTADPKKTYGRYMTEHKDEFSKKVEDHIGTGGDLDE